MRYWNSRPVGIAMEEAECIYADYQATTPVDPRVLAEMAPYWEESFGNPHSSDHIVGWRAKSAVDEAALSVSSLIGGDADELIFTSGATEANNLALLGVARRSSGTRRRILVSAIEHKCVLAAARALVGSDSFAIGVIPVDSYGRIDIEVLAEMLDDTVALVSVMAVNNEIGVMQDIALIAGLLARDGILLHCDAAQAPCAMDVGELALYADMVSLSGHKMYGPQGIGALYVRRDLHDCIEPMIYGGGQQGELRSGTLPLPLCVGMGAAARISGESEAVPERERIAKQRDRFVNLLRGRAKSIIVNGPPEGDRHPGNANLQFSACNAHDILGVLQPRLAASTGAACSSGTPEPSHVLRAIGLSESESNASIRFSFGRFTSDQDIRRAADCVLEALSCIRAAAAAPERRGRVP